MFVSELFGLAQPEAVDDRGVVELVRKDGVLGTEDLLKEAGVGVEATRVENGVFATVEVGDFLLKFLKLINQLMFYTLEIIIRIDIAAEMQRATYFPKNNIGIV